MRLALGTILSQCGCEMEGLARNSGRLTNRLTLRPYHWLLGISIDGPEQMHDLYRYNRAGHGTWRKVMDGIETLKKHKVDFNVLCVLSQANVEKPKEVYRFFRSLGIEYIQYIPLAEFDAAGNPLPFTVTPD